MRQVEMYNLIVKSENMLKLCSSFNESQHVYAYKRDAIKYFDYHLGRKGLRR